LGHHVVETNGAALIGLIKTIPGPRYLCFEESTHSAWLYEILSPHVDEAVVVALRRSRGPKSDKADAFGHAESLRTNSIKMRVFKDVGRYRMLRELARVHRMLVNDSVRIQNRIGSLYRSRATPCSRAVYQPEQRSEQVAMLPASTQRVADLLLRDYDAVEQLRAEAQKSMLAEARKHPITKLLQTVPGLGPIRVAHLVPIIITPDRFRTRSQLWSYCGLGIVTRSSSDWAQDEKGNWRRVKVPMARGLNRNHNTVLKETFKGAATTVIGKADTNCPLYRHYASMLDNKTKPNLAKVTIARQIAAITLALWKKEAPYDPAVLSNKS
jgi:transposase